MAAIPSTPPWPWSITGKNMQKTEPALIEPAPLMFLGILYLPRRGIVGAWACPDAPSSIRRNRRGERLPLEGKLAQLSLRLMRSKRSFITMSRYKIATFDLIRHAFGVTPSPPGEGSPQKGRQPSTKSNRTPPPSHASVAHIPLHAGRLTPRRGYPYSPPGRYKLPVSFSQRCHLG